MAKPRIAFRKGYKFQLVEEYRIQTPIRYTAIIDTGLIRLTQDGWLTIQPLYAWDGVTGAINTDTNYRGGLVHDSFYQLMRMGLLPRSFRGATDKFFKEICLKDGMNKIRAGYFHIGVDVFAAKAASSAQRKRIIFAP